MKASAIFLCFAALVPSVQAAESTALTLPTTIQAVLNQEYPGWKLAPVDKTVWQEFNALKPDHAPSLMTSDFDQDGRKDWALQIVLTKPGEEEQFLTVFLARENSYQEVIVESRGPDPSVYLWKARKTFTESVSGRQKPASQVQLILRGGPLGDSVYIWEGGEFREAPRETPLPDPSE